MKTSDEEAYLGLNRDERPPISPVRAWLYLILVAVFLGTGAGFIANADQSTSEVQSRKATEQ